MATLKHGSFASTAVVGGVVVVVAAVLRCGNCKCGIFAGGGADRAFCKMSRRSLVRRKLERSGGGDVDNVDDDGGDEVEVTDDDDDGDGDADCLVAGVCAAADGGGRFAVRLSRKLLKILVRVAFDPIRGAPIVGECSGGCDPAPATGKNDCCVMLLWC